MCLPRTSIPLLSGGRGQSGYNGIKGAGLPPVNQVVALLLRSSGIARTPQGTGPGFKSPAQRNRIYQHNYAPPSTNTSMLSQRQSHGNRPTPTSISRTHRIAPTNEPS
uniref:Uncharacterized protein n=1 Tax=Picea glauca TaxID=3330 RepID=A0A101LWD4_PICGL|nr:hypothetical protein ABT39_MTgene1662 [Picea glauca]QHR87944.1 hypothetical protein Q903MT_gene1956 [Picea sitchensis]